MEPNEFYRALGVPPPKPGAVWVVYEYAGLSTIQAYAVPGEIRRAKMPPKKGFFGNAVEPPQSTTMLKQRAPLICPPKCKAMEWNPPWAKPRLDRSTCEVFRFPLAKVEGHRVASLCPSRCQRRSESIGSPRFSLARWLCRNRHRASRGRYGQVANRLPVCRVHGKTNRL